MRWGGLMRRGGFACPSSARPGALFLLLPEVVAMCAVAAMFRFGTMPGFVAMPSVVPTPRSGAVSSVIAMPSFVTMARFGAMPSFVAVSSFGAVSRFGAASGVVAVPSFIAMAARGCFSMMAAPRAGIAAFGRRRPGVLVGRRLVRRRRRSRTAAFGPVAAVRLRRGARLGGHACIFGGGRARRWPRMTPIGRGPCGVL